MTHQVTVAAGLHNVVLPDGLRYKAGDVAQLADGRYSTIGAQAKAALFSGDARTGQGIRLFANAAGLPGAVSSDPSAYTMAIQFSVSQATFLRAIWFYTPSGAAALPGTIALFAVSGQSLMTSQAASWSGAVGSGWVRAAFSSPPALAAGASYKAAVLQASAVNWYPDTVSYWTTGDGVNGAAAGILSAPNNAGADGGQDSFNAGASLTYPLSTFSGSNYWVDPEVG